MVNEGQNSNDKSEDFREDFTFQLTDPMLYDRLRTLSAEYSVSSQMLINVAVKRLINEIDFVRSLRSGRPK